MGTLGFADDSNKFIQISDAEICLADVGRVPHLQVPFERAVQDACGECQGHNATW